MSRSNLRWHHHAAYAGFRTLLAAGSRMPLGTLGAFGGLLGRTALGLSRRDRQRAEEALGAAFPELAESQRDLLLRRFARHMGRVLGEVVWLWRARFDDVRRVCTVTGGEHLQETLDAGRGAVLITGHVGNWEMLNARLGIEGVPLSIAVREVYDPRVDAVACGLRSRFGSEVIHRGERAGRRLVKAVRGNRVAGLLIDQDIRDIPGVFVPFFGRPAWTPTGAAIISLKTGAPIVPAFGRREAPGRHEALVEPPLPRPDTGDFEQDVRQLTADCTAAIERAIRRQPEQWVWMHRRWRTTPEDVARRGSR